ncbi:MAG: serine hydrolase domain-containing protein [Sphingobium sp.]|uniref:serine hydrolase domain-containing protein n=1 Tax=Sphingobium sp. TaxID=1912891 RepID=UPI0029B69A33|nr:serine hydrolase domain-containing protein [Sphingobium sp.]MDX3909762.1 serine hydrolase domain-containing protein [Sphingobium sp.]
MSETFVTGAAESAGFDPRRLNRLAAFLDQQLVSGKLPHAQLLLSRDEQPVAFCTLGHAREDGTPLQEDALFRIASMTKPITSVAFMMLVEDGLVGLDTPVHRILPEFRDLAVRTGGGEDGEPFSTRPTEAPMRMIDLLRHSSGLTYSFQQQSPIDAAYAAQKLDVFHQARTSDEYIAALAALPLEFSPGAGWNYSVSTDVLGIVVERLSGLSLADFFAERIFSPLAMTDTFFEVPPDHQPRLTDAWQADNSGTRTLYDRGQNSRWRLPPRSYSGGGGLVSSTQDYHRFCRMLLRGGELDGTRLLSPKMVALMTANHLPGGGDLAGISRSMFSESQNAGIGFGLGFAVTCDPVAAMLPGSIGEYYWGGMLSTFFFVDPVERIVAIFMTQVMPSTAISVRRELKTLIYAALTESRA